MNKRIVVTGAAGYIGGITALRLCDAGYAVTAVDRTPSAIFSQFQQLGIECVTADFADYAVSDDVHAVIHCAGTSLVGPSIANPGEYWHNNLVKTLMWLNDMPRYTRVVFSSSAAVYGVQPCPIREDAALMPISPYGDTKLAVERVLSSYGVAHGLDWVAFRYFNAAGADRQARWGQMGGATHVIARVLESIRDGSEFTIYGSEYDTPDGTAVRDYVHVDDIATAHLKAIDSVDDRYNLPSGAYNLSTGVGHSVLDVIEVAQRVTGQAVVTRVGPNRVGDPDQLVADPTKLAVALGWRPSYNLETVVQDAWRWYCRDK